MLRGNYCRTREKCRFPPVSHQAPCWYARQIWEYRPRLYLYRYICSWTWAQPGTAVSCTSTEQTWLRSTFTAELRSLCTDPSSPFPETGQGLGEDALRFPATTCARRLGASRFAAPCAAPHLRLRLRCKARVYWCTVRELPASGIRNKSCQPAKRAPSDQRENLICSTSEDKHMFMNFRLTRFSIYIILYL